MSGGRSVKQRGTSYEVRLVKWIANRAGWQAKRIPLSGASQFITECIGGHDVKAWNESLNIHLTIEAKKRGKVTKEEDCHQIIIQKKWLENNLDFDKDNLLVFATNQSPHYTFLPLHRYFQILNRKYDIVYTSENTFKGKSQFLFKREYIDNNSDSRFHLLWDNQPYVVILLEDFITLRETANLHDDLSTEDQIVRLSSLDKAIEFEKLNLDSLTYSQKKLLYTKLEQIESGEVIHPIAHANEQFWLKDDAFVLVCPKCNEKITKADLKP